MMHIIFRIENANKNQENYLEKLEEQLGDLKIANYNIENKKTNLQNLLWKHLFYMQIISVEIIGGKILF